MGFGVTGREVKSAWARSNTWGTPASVTRQVLLQSTEGWEDKPQYVEDPAFNQDFIAEAEVGDLEPPTPGIRSQATGSISSIPAAVSWTSNLWCNTGPCGGPRRIRH